MHQDKPTGCLGSNLDCEYFKAVVINLIQEEIYLPKLNEKHKS